MIQVSEDILAEAGYEQVYDVDEIITRMPTPEETARLEIPAGTPVAEHIRTGYTADNKARGKRTGSNPGTAPRAYSARTFGAPGRPAP